AIDPEMLGKVFENLLDVNDRKSKGAFYTPREIVHYMCQESLINYLTREINVSEAAVRDFILYGDFMKGEDTVKEKRQGNGTLYISEELYKLDNNGNVVINKLTDMDKALAEVRVADPAVGSGAFPLGMLNEIVRARQNISAYYSITMNPNQTRLMYSMERSPYALKYQTIKNCIFAADIEPSAVDIAQLRLWLSLVIDDEINPNADPNNPLDGHRNPTPLPNLECNILCGNSLIDEFEGIKLINQDELLGTATIGDQTNIWGDSFSNILPRLIDAQDRLFRCDDTNKKHEIMNEISAIKDMIILSQMEGVDSEIVERYKESKKLASKPYVLWQLDFARVFKEKGGFDIVIGNPPYIKERDNKDVFEPVNNTMFGKKYHQGKMDYWFYFLHKAIDILNIKGNITYITPRYWLNSSGASNLVKRIKTDLSFVGIVDIGKLKVFDNVVGYHMIAQYQKKKIEHCVCKKLENTLSDISKQSDTSNLKLTILNNEDIITENYEIRLEPYKKYDDCIQLGTIADISQGVVEASDKISKRMYSKKPRDDMFVGKGIFVLSEEELAALELSEYEMKFIVPYIRGESIKRYTILPSKEYLIYSDKETRKIIANSDKTNKLRRHLDLMSDYITSSNGPYGLHRPRNKSIFDNKKILVPSMFATNDFAIDYSEQLFVGMSFNCILVNHEYYCEEYILAILNSSFAKDWFYTEGKKRGAGVDIGVEKLRTFPIKPCNKSVQYEIAEKVKLLHENYEEHRNLDRELDELICNLYSNQ
ncbi:MAG: TaqI-like C-terminal specificity domain-containing protein, partial [Erysipelotrichaceae bacterium]|nr:TaqI-like C-terminal specificity domain-containing protein [Erysipelotrichaceae bacterium]